MTRSEKAAELFLSGCNCAQSVFAAFCNDTGLDEVTALKLSSAFGGGFARTRELCGAVSGMAMVVGCLIGRGEGDINAANGAVYEKTRVAQNRFQECGGSYNCAELLKSVENLSVGGSPQKRNEEYYKVRPCLKLVLLAVNILEEMFFQVN